MLTVGEAKKILAAKIKVLFPEKKKVTEALDFVLAENIRSPFDSPQFNQSAMDGFAIRIDYLPEGKPSISLPVIGEIKAGDQPILKLRPDTAVQILTGAAVPLNATCVVIQEKTKVTEGQVIIPVSAVVKGSNIRFKGTQIRKGELALDKGMKLNPAAIGFLSSMGLTEIKVVRKPKISILSTGNELIEPEHELSPGKIYESNSRMLYAAVKQSGFDAIVFEPVIDDGKKILRQINNMLNASDVLIISGGISVGKYDLVKEVLIKLGVKEIFYKVSQKPGKPLFTGFIKDKLIFAVPGNPAASLVCFYEYVVPSLRKMSGYRNHSLRTEFVPLAESFEMKSERDLFLRARVENGKVHIPKGQESNMLKSFSEANALVYLPAGTKKIPRGRKVEVHFLL